MDRHFLLDIEQQRATRPFARQFELRASDRDPDHLVFEGMASVTEYEYPIMGGVWPGWMETIAAGAFKKTLREKADVKFLVNHDGMTLARTKSGTMTLTEITEGSPTGLHVEAHLDRRMQPVADLLIASERGDIDEMSFAFRVVKDEWYDDNDAPSNALEGTKRRITEVNLNKGDVSAVNTGANPATSGSFRALEQALAELRAGRQLTDELRDALRELVADPTSQPEPAVPAMSRSFATALADRYRVRVTAA
jgi:HK97 family phage prohead protease